MVQNGIKVDLPQGNSKEVGSQQELVVTMSKDEKLFFNSYPIERKELVQSVQKALSQRDDIPVYVRADESLSYGRVIEIVDELKQPMAIGEVFAKSGMFPDVKSQAQAVVKILAGKELGLSPFESMGSIYVVNGRLSLTAKAKPFA